MKAVVALALALLTAACAGVPQNSRPQVVRAIDDGGQTQAETAVGPTPGEDPRSIVSGFLHASVLSTSGARQFLTLDEQSKWQASPVVIVDYFQVGNASAQAPGGSQVVVTPDYQIGRLDASGVYNPNLKGDSAAPPAPYTYTLKKDSNGQWRIDSLPPGVLITQSDFGVDYRPRQLYFLDTTERSLIPDQRYTSLTGQQLLTWLMKQVLAGPRPALASSVVNEVPPQVDAAHITVTSGDPIQVEMPGVDQTDASGKLKLAEQLAFTLGTQSVNGSVELTDTGRPVVIPTVNGTSFSAADFPAVDPVNTYVASGEFFVRNGQLYDGADQTPAPAPLGDPNLGLTSVAVQGVDRGTLSVVAVAGAPTGQQRVLLGRTGQPAYTVVAGLPAGQLSRPEWQPRSSTAWIGVGASAAIYQISQAGQPKAVSVTPLSGGAPTGQITDLRFSPDGSRLAVLVQGGAGADSVWVGSVVRSGANVSIGSFEPITPSNLDVSDVAWRDNLVLYIIAKQPSSAERSSGIWSVSSDGSDLVSVPLTGLPAPATAIAAGQDDPPIVVSDNTLWVLSSDFWTAFGGTTAPIGDSPVYSH